MRYEKPDILSSFSDAEEHGPTDAEVKFAERWTRIRTIVVEDVQDAHTAWLVVGGQQFCLNRYSDTAAEASWTCWLLAKALLKIQKTT